VLEVLMQPAAIEVAPLIFVAAGFGLQDREYKSAQVFYAIRR
jgi:hypothetical protein